MDGMKMQVLCDFDLSAGFILWAVCLSTLLQCVFVLCTLSNRRAALYGRLRAQETDIDSDVSCLLHFVLGWHSETARTQQNTKKIIKDIGRAWPVGTCRVKNFFFLWFSRFRLHSVTSMYCSSYCLDVTSVLYEYVQNHRYKIHV